MNRVIQMTGTLVLHTFANIDSDTLRAHFLLAKYLTISQFPHISHNVPKTCAQMLHVTWITLYNRNSMANLWVSIKLAHYIDFFISIRVGVNIFFPSWVYIAGVRLGKISTKIALATLLHKYNFECLNDRELEFDSHSLTLVVKGGINVRITNRKI